MAGNTVYVQGNYVDVHDNQEVNLYINKATVQVEDEMDTTEPSTPDETTETHQNPLEEKPNCFAPQKNISVMLCQSWFDACSQDKMKFTLDWRESLMEDLMASEYGKEIAKDWTDPEKRTQVKCAIVGALIDAGVLKSSYNALAPELGITAIAAASLAKYMGYGKKQPYYDWLMEYVKK